MENRDSHGIEISVIVSNFNGAKWIPRLIETLLEQRGVELEIIIVDRNSRDQSMSLLANYPQVKTVSHPPETGLVSGYTYGGKFATKPLLFFCNEDMWFEPDCLLLTANAIRTTEGVAAAMPVQYTYDLSELVNCGAWFTRSRWCPSNPYPFRESRFHVPENTRITAQANAGACMIDRKVFESIGGWDTDFFLDYEDTDLSLRLWQNNWYCVVVPAAKVGHAVGASNNQSLERGKIKVSRKRYIGGGANLLAIAIKTFTGVDVVWPFVSLTERWGRNMVRLRWREAYWDCLVVVEALRRLPSLLRFRAKNASLNSQRPGQRYFLAPEFDYSELSQSGSRSS